MCEICRKLTTKTLEQRQLHHSGVFNVNFRKDFTHSHDVPIVDSEQVNAGWVSCTEAVAQICSGKRCS